MQKQFQNQQPEEILCILDIGSNSCKMKVYRVSPEGYQHLESHDVESKPHLGQMRKEEEDGRPVFILREDNMREALRTISSARDTIENLRREGYRVTVKAFGTAALRHAANSSDFVTLADALLFRKIGGESMKIARAFSDSNENIPDSVLDKLKSKKNLPEGMEIISGEREAELIMEGVSLVCGDTQGVVIDLGGRSCELIMLPSGKSISLDIGTRVLKEMEEQSRNPDLLKDNIKNLTDDRADAMLSDARAHNKGILVLGGGTLKSIGLRVCEPPAVIDDFENLLDIHTFNSVLSKIVELGDVKKIAQAFPGLSEKRVPDMVSTAIFMQHIITLGGFSHCVFTEKGVRDGYLKIFMNERVYPLRALPNDNPQEERFGRNCVFQCEKRV